MPAWPKPRLVVSQCLGFAACRWNRVMLPDDFVERLKPHVTFLPVCAEVEIGLGIPREPVRLVKTPEGVRMVQPATGADLMARLHAFAATYLASLGQVEGFILKSRSPSCGLRDTKLYPHTVASAAMGRGSGLFGGAVLARYAGLAIEDEARLKNPRIREHFLIQLFTLARFHQARATGTAAALVRFQAEHKLLLMAYHQVAMRSLGRIVANPAQRSWVEVWDDYARLLQVALKRPPRCASHLNVLMHALGYFSERLTTGEKASFLDALAQYRAGHLPLRIAAGLVRAWIVRFGQAYLRSQTYFQPYPEALADPSRDQRLWAPGCGTRPLGVRGDIVAR